MTDIATYCLPIPRVPQLPLKKRIIHSNYTSIHSPPKPILRRMTNSIENQLTMGYDAHLETICPSIECTEVNKNENKTTLQKDLETFGLDFMMEIFGDFTTKYDYNSW